jgi:flavodoxin
MKACVLYYSLSGNTKRFAEAISDALQIPAFNLVNSEHSIVEKFDILILGTPVHGFSPARTVLSFLDNLPDGKGKKAIVFCTYVIRKGNALEKLEKELANKGYNVILGISKRGLRLSEEDFSDAINEMSKVLEE